MKTTLSLIITLLTFATFLSAQSTCFDIEWNKTLGSTFADDITRLKVNDDGMLYGAGYAGDKNEDFEGVNYPWWSGRFSPEGELENLFPVRAGFFDFDAFDLGDGKMLIAGSESGSLNFNVKIVDEAGEILELYDYGEEFGQFFNYCSMIPLSNGDFIIAIEKDNSGNRFEKTLLVRWTNTGEIVWSKYIDVPVFDIKIADNGDFYIASSTDVQQNLTRLDFMEISRYSSDGTLQWTTRKDQVNAHFIGPLRGKVTITADGNLVFPGAKLNSASEIEGFLWMLDKDGNTLWEKGYPEGYSIASTVETSNGDLINIGFKRYEDGDIDVWLMGTDATGNIKCSEYIGSSFGPDHGTILTKGLDGAIYGAAHLQSEGAIFRGMKGMQDIWLFKLASDLVGTSNVSNVDLGVQLSPNPMYDFLQIQFSETIVEGRLEVFDVSGKKLKEVSINHQTQLEWATHNWAKGTYFMKIFNQLTGEMQVEKMVKM